MLKPMLKLAAGQLAVFAGLLAVVDAVLWLVAPISFTQQQVRFSQDIPGSKPRITFTSFASGFRSLTLTDLRKPAGSMRVLSGWRSCRAKSYVGRSIGLPARRSSRCAARRSISSESG